MDLRIGITNLTVLRLGNRRKVMQGVTYLPEEVNVSLTKHVGEDKNSFTTSEVRRRAAH